jgi:hypothetical protein
VQLTYKGACIGRSLRAASRQQGLSNHVDLWVCHENSLKSW